MMNGRKRPSEDDRSDSKAKRKYNVIPYLCQAACDNDASKCKGLLENHEVDVNGKSSDGNTALHGASKCNNTEILTLLLDFGADINSKNDHGYTPLHMCSQHNSKEASDLLLNKGADVNVQNSFKNTPLHLAAIHNNPEVCKVLLENDSDINAKGINDSTPLHLAVQHNSMETCQELLSQQANVDALKIGERTPLHDAASKSDGNKLCRLLIEYEADINASNSNGKTALHICCEILNELPQKASKMKKSGYRNIISTLLTYGADPCKENVQGLSCLALYGTNQEINKLLQDAKKLSLFQKWVRTNPRSQKHVAVLSKVANGQKSKQVSSYEYYKQPIGSGAFGHVHAGMCTKDGREVAIKRIDITKLPTDVHKREIKNLIRLRGCQKIVNYIDFYEKENIHFVVLELMEGTLDDLELPTDPASEAASTTRMICKDIIEALNFLHTNNIIHRDIKPNNILYLTYPRKTLKLADFGLSTRIENETSTVMHSAAGTKCWMAPEVINSLEHSKASDVFSSALVLHHLLANKKHAFAPADTEGVSQCTLSQFKIEHEITDNILKHKLNISACLDEESEAHHLIEEMLHNSKQDRPTAEEVLNHPFFWRKKKKVDFLIATANQPIGSNFKIDLESSLGKHFQTQNWSGWSPLLGKIYNDMLSSGRRGYNTASASDLLRFIRNAYQHASDGTHTESFKEEVFDNFVFLKEFTFLVTGVYKVVKKHHWDVHCKEIRNAISNLEEC